MKTAAFTLENIFYPETTVKANIDFDREHETPPSEPEVKITIPQQVGDQEEPILQMVLTVTISAASPSDRYEIGVLSVGRFKSNGDLSFQDFVKQMIRSGPNMLYSATREHVLSITSRSAWGEYNLPAVVFDPEDFQNPSADE